VRFGGQPVAAAADAALAEVKALGGDGGVIVVGKAGDPVMPFNSAGMYRAMATGAGVRTVKIYGDE
jgi:beta-aspartyl-peptidase (threonine type)